MRIASRAATSEGGRETDQSIEGKLLLVRVSDRSAFLSPRTEFFDRLTQHEACHGKKCHSFLGEIFFAVECGMLRGKVKLNCAPRGGCL
jgi:hypothetical protein